MVYAYTIKKNDHSVPELIYSVLNTCINASTDVYTYILFLTVCIIDARSHSCAVATVFSAAVSLTVQLE